MKLRTAKLILLGFLLLVGAALLLYKFPSVPKGLHQDEMSEAYEAYCLLQTGADRWGYHLPVYFLSWGSGQNVLQAYLTVPVVAVLGLTALSARLVPLLCGLFTLPLFFYTLRRWYGEGAALLGLLFLAVSPWHIMLSRIGIENAPAPLFLLLGVYTFGKALEKRTAAWIVPCLLPFALALYTYGVVIIITPIIVALLLLLLDPGAFRSARRAWLAALALFGVLGLPLFFFIFKNYITKTSYAFERWLPFSVPLLTQTRLDQSMEMKQGSTVLLHNLKFLSAGLSDERTMLGVFLPWFQIRSVFPMSKILLCMAVVGIACVLWRVLRERRFKDPFFLWLAGCAPLLFLVPLNISRAIAMFLPLLALAAFGCHELYLVLPWKLPRIALALVVLMGTVVSSAPFVRDYYGPNYASQSNASFNPELPDALQKALRLAGPSTQLYVTQAVWLNYVQVLFLTRTSPRVFQSSGATPSNPDFGPYRFSRDTLSPSGFVFIVKAADVIRWDVTREWNALLNKDDPSSAATFDRWNALLTQQETDGLHTDLTFTRSFPRDLIPSLIKRQLAEPNGAGDTPLCAFPAEVVRDGQFIVGRCP